MKPYILLITLTLSLLSCTRPTEYNATLSQVESYIEARPDSVLTVLQISVSSLRFLSYYSVGDVNDLPGQGVGGVFCRGFGVDADNRFRV